jgi:serine/threonine protein kinase
MIGQTVSHYAITEKLGEGGMGVVYKAMDTSLDRPVALKFLPTDISASAEDKARFVQEAKSAAALNHPNICTVHGIEEHDSRQFIVMEYVDGQMLSEKRHSISFKQAIDIGIQIADGLAAAHEKGIVHRDIKPENIMIRKDGIVQIMDFGLAKLRGVSRLTKEGSTVGTAGYMSPEQIQGLDVDHRSDIFSLGVILYELFTGQPPFKGVHETAITYEIVNVDAQPMSAVVPALDPALDAIVLECLAKEPAERYQAVAEVAKELRRFKRESTRQRVSRVSRAGVSGVMPPATSGVSAVLGSTTEPPSTGSPRSPRLWKTAALVFLVGFLVMSALFLLPGEPSSQAIWASVDPPPGMLYRSDYGGHAAISPDGKTLAFVAVDSAGESLLWYRQLSHATATRLSGTSDASYPFWSPDNHSIGFFAQGKLKRISISGGPPVTVCNASAGRGGSWAEDNTILFAPEATSPLVGVNVEGGDPEPVTALDSLKKEDSHRLPQILPGGERFLYVVQHQGQLDSQDEIRIRSFDGAFDEVILRGSSNAIYASGYLFYVRESSLLAQPFDVGSAQFTGEPQPLATDVQYFVPRSKGNFTVSSGGILLFATGSSESEDEMLWLDREGHRQGTITSVSPIYWARLSPDGSRIVFDDYDARSRNYDLWMYDIARNVKTRFTFGETQDIVALWSPKGERVFYSSNPNGPHEIFAKQADGMKGEEMFLKGEHPLYVTSLTSDGRYALLSEQFANNGSWDLSYVDLGGDRKATALLQTQYNEWVGNFSPDGHWMVYQSDESGRYEVYVRPFRSEGGKWQLSTEGGDSPRWITEKEIFFESRGRLMVVDVTLTSSGPRFGIPRKLFDIAGPENIRVFDITRDGKRILVTRSTGRNLNDPMTLVVNWPRALESR